MKYTSVLIVDDHPIVTMALDVILNNNGYDVVGSAKDGIQAMSMIKEKEPSIVIIDIGIPGIDGFEVISRTTKLKINTKFLVISSSDNKYYAYNSIKLGASGFVSKTNDLKTIVFALNAIQSGYKFFPDDIKLNSYNNSVSLDILSPKELLVVNYLKEGRSNNEISEIMLISPKTVSSYKRRIFDKLNVDNFVEFLDKLKNLEFE
ncbi:TPA: response regulator [Vibrio parahaemolyticus]|uniref:response regulator transcription factor n=1 Tax=Vibrio alginolyticus TaxID=663 RepID=UPI001BD31012|nr:response regulator transcription factor [Vibrio alginolyticus]MBS9848135.1 response regulator transcription factor [Vibrio alginolyticus]